MTEEKPWAQNAWAPRGRRGAYWSRTCRPGPKARLLSLLSLLLSVLTQKKCPQIVPAETREAVQTRGQGGSLKKEHRHGLQVLKRAG